MEILIRPFIGKTQITRLHRQLKKAGCTVNGVTFHSGQITVQLDDDSNLQQATDLVDNYTGYNVDDAKDDKCAEFNRLRDSIVEYGFDHVIDGEAHTFEGRDRDAIRLSSLYQEAVRAYADNTPFNEVFRDKGNCNHEFNAVQFMLLYADAVMAEKEAVFKCVALKAMVVADNEKTVEQILAIDVKQEWDNYVYTA